MFIEFLLSALLQALQEVPSTDQVTDQGKALLKCLGKESMMTVECMKKLGLSHWPTFRKNYLQPAMKAGWVEMTVPEKPNSRLQKYRRVAEGVFSENKPDRAQPVPTR